MVNDDGDLKLSHNVAAANHHLVDDFASIMYSQIKISNLRGSTLARSFETYFYTTTAAMVPW